MNDEKKMMIFAVTMAVFALGTSMALADPSAPTSLSTVQSSSRDLSTLAGQTAEAQGGNVTELNIQALTVTKSWQGYYGDVTGEIALGDASNNTFYNWSLASVEGQVYATRVSSLTWDDVNCSSAANITAEETYLGHVAADGDSVTNTYTVTTHPGFNVTTSAQVYVDTCPSTYAFVNNNSQSSDWVQLLLHDGGANIVYTTIMNDSTEGFDGGTHDFQLLVGENEHDGSIGVTQYNFWVQLI